MFVFPSTLNEREPQVPRCRLPWWLNRGCRPLALAAASVVVAVEVVRVCADDGEVAVRDVAAVEVRWRRRDADGGVAGVADGRRRGCCRRRGRRRRWGSGRGR